MKGRGRGAGVARLQQRLEDATQENARLRLSLLRSEAGVFELRAELERLREDLCRRAQRRRREQQALRELAEEHLAFTSYIRMLQSTNRILRESDGSLRSALLLGSCGGPEAVRADCSVCPWQSSASSEDSASPSNTSSQSSEDACSASPAQGTQETAVQVKELLVDGEQTTLQIWDTAGQERYRSIARSYFRKAHGVLLLYDISSQSSFLSVRQWIEDIEGAGTALPLMLVGNKSDLRAGLPEMVGVHTAHGQRLAMAHNCLFCETSAKDGTNVVEAVLHLARAVKRTAASGSGARLDLSIPAPRAAAGCCRA